MAGGCRFCRILTFSYSDYVALFFAVFVSFCVVFYACLFGMHPIDNVIRHQYRVTSTFMLNV